MSPPTRKLSTWPDWQVELVAGLERAGASKVGFADLSVLPAEIRSGLPHAIAIAVALDAGVVAELVSGPTVAYHAEYDRVNALLSTLAKNAVDFLVSRGYAARTGAVTVKSVDGDGATALPHKTVATRAGLGWIGDCALLITPDFGAAVRLASVLTDAPLVCDEAVVLSRCGTCRACVHACPAGAVAGKLWHAGIARQEILDVEACKRKASSLATAQGIDVIICGICVNACPWTRRYLRHASRQTAPG